MAAITAPAVVVLSRLPEAMPDTVRLLVDAVPMLLKSYTASAPLVLRVAQVTQPLAALFWRVRLPRANNVPVRSKPLPSTLSWPATLKLESGLIVALPTE